VERSQASARDTAPLAVTVTKQIQKVVMSQAIFFRNEDLVGLSEADGF